jgi:hypothetical protein
VSTLDRLIARLQEDLQQAEDTERENRQAGSPPESRAFDAGRVDGIRYALDVLISARSGAIR